MPLPNYLYHAAPIDVAALIAEDGLQPRSGKDDDKYLCMSGSENGATTLKAKASDIIFRVKSSHLNEADWSKQGAGREEWRSKQGIEASVLEFRRNLGDRDQLMWRSVAFF